ncbi:hypothetical protein AGMMS49942_04610 [Spirochaetia bacterium]|nr:hypothetical protein AGMMS49942_04610 [Spirochaetia bacterium]
MTNKTYNKVFNEAINPLASKIIRACSKYISNEANNAAAGIGSVDSRKILFLNALALAELTRDKVVFTKIIYDILEDQNLHSANAYYLSPSDEFFLTTPRDEILCNDELYKDLQ